MDRTASSPAYRRLIVAALIVHAFAAAIAVTLAFRVITFPYPVEFGEAYLLDQVVRLAAGEPLFRPSMSSPPYILTNYPPVFITLQLPFYLIAGPAYWYGRLISYCGGLAAVVCVGLTVHRLTGDRFAAWLGAVALGTAPYLVTWSPYSRIDASALGISWIGLYAIVRSQSARGVVAGGLLIAAAAFTRQTEFVAPSAAGFVWLLANGRRGDAVRLTATVIAAGVTVFAALNLLTGGGFVFNTVTANIHEADVWRSAGSFLGLVFASPALLAGAGLCLLLVRGPAGWFAAAYIVSAGAVSLTVAKEGSSFNYFLELVAGCALAFALVVSRMQRHVVVYGALIALLVARTVLGLADFRYGTEPYSRLAHRPQQEQLLELIRAAPDPILADETAGLLPLIGRRLYIEPFEMVQIARSGHWSSSQLVPEIDRRAFGLILLTREAGNPLTLQSRWHPEVLDAVQRSYESAGDIPISATLTTTVYRPRAR